MKSGRPRSPGRMIPRSGAARASSGTGAAAPPEEQRLELAPGRLRVAEADQQASARVEGWDTRRQAGGLREAHQAGQRGWIAADIVPRDLHGTALRERREEHFGPSAVRAVGTREDLERGKLLRTRTDRSEEGQRQREQCRGTAPHESSCATGARHRYESRSARRAGQSPCRMRKKFGWPVEAVKPPSTTIAAPVT